MSHTIKQFCDKIDSVKKMADKLRKTPPSDNHIKNQIENIQSDCLLLSRSNVDIKEEHNYDYSGVDHGGL